MIQKNFLNPGKIKNNIIFGQTCKCSIFDFIWDERDRIKRYTIIGKIEDGGVGLVDIELKLKSYKIIMGEKTLR